MEDQEINLEDQKFDAELTPTQAFVEKYDTTKDLEDVKPEAEAGTRISITTSTHEDPTSQALKDDENNTVNNSNLYRSNEPISASLFFTQEPQKLFSMRSEEATNPEFIVQTYGYIRKNKSYSTGGNLDIYNMSKTYETAGSDQLSAHYKVLDDDKTDNGKVIQKKGEIEKTDLQLTELYKDRTNLKYFEHPTLKYMNTLSNESNYTLSEVWEKIDKNTYNDLDTNRKYKDSENRYWRKIDPDKVNFTNHEQSFISQNGYKGDWVLIKQGTVIKLVYKETTSTFISNANFYDYDISLGASKYKTNSTTNSFNKYNVVKNAQGINSDGNYNFSSNVTNRLAFGNANTGTGLHTRYLGTNNTTYINQAYKYGIPGKSGAWPVINIVGDKLNNNGHLNYINNVIAPNLFEEGDATGKNNINGGKLQFKRNGDTYTLTNVSGGGLSASNLDKFNHPSYKYGNYEKIHTDIYTNNFWPLDNTQHNDGLSGKITGRTDEGSYYTGKYFNGVNKDLNGQLRTYYPPSDDSKDHNSLFGMTYEIRFQLDEEYAGPLEYFFFGDDDLWAYLIPEDENGNPNYSQSRKIIDLGGVKSSYGAHVDFRKSSKTLAPGKYRIKIFYTERGLSGSTCYLQFTLPKVSGISTVPSEQLKSLTITKYTEDNDFNLPYSFNVKLFDQSGNPLTDRYPVSIYNSDNVKVEDNAIGHNGTLNLKKNQKAVISYLPQGTKYQISEIEVDSNTQVYINTNGVFDSNSQVDADGKSELFDVGSNAHIFFKNVRSFTLPETGGIGIEPPIMASGISVIATSGYVVILRKKGWWSKKKK